MYIHSHKAVKL